MIDTRSQRVRFSIQLAARPLSGCPSLAPKHVGRKEIPCNYLRCWKETR